MKHSCGGKTTVYDSREDAGTIRRRRRCLACGVRFVTLETPVEAAQAGKVEVPGVVRSVRGKASGSPAMRRVKARRRIEEIADESEYDDLGTWGGLIGRVDGNGDEG